MARHPKLFNHANFSRRRLEMFENYFIWNLYLVFVAGYNYNLLPGPWDGEVLILSYYPSEIGFHGIIGFIFSPGCQGGGEGEVPGKRGGWRLRKLAGLYIVTVKDKNKLMLYIKLRYREDCSHNKFIFWDRQYILCKDSSIKNVLIFFFFFNETLAVLVS